MALLIALFALPAAAIEVLETGQGPFPLPAGRHGARELSAITWDGKDRYLAVSDKEAALFRLSVRVDPASGRVTGAEVIGQMPLGQGSDLEGLARAADGTVYVSDEVGPAVRRHDVATGRLLGSLRLPPVYAGVRSNLSLESLALSADGRTLWTGNEEALKGDGPTNRQSGGQGTVVRLQRIRADGKGRWRPDGQWAYRVDGVEPFLGRAPSGLADLAVLSDGTLLALERAAGFVGLGGDLPTVQVRFRSRLYAVDLRGATDTSRLARLPPTVAAVRKTLLWESTFPGHNFEGIAVGPALRGGELSVLLVSDDGNGLEQSLYALRLRPGRPAACGRR